MVRPVNYVLGFLTPSKFPESYRVLVVVLTPEIEFERVQKIHRTFFNAEHNFLQLIKNSTKFFFCPVT